MADDCLGHVDGSPPVHWIECVVSLGILNS